LRINVFHILPTSAVAKLSVFDTIASVACLFSIYALTRKTLRIRYILIGRAIDMFRFTQFFPTFRDIITTSGNIISLVMGPLILVMCTMHVYCYIGMYLWGGKIEVGEVENILPFYDNLNFNSYESGILTMFQILIVNDWHQIAAVFLSVGKEWVVFTFFISALTICVTILLNAFISFFIAAFETGNQNTENETFFAFGKITTGVSIVQTTRSIKFNSKSFSFGDHSSVDSVKELDVYERQDVDEVLRKVTGEGVEDKFSFIDMSKCLDIFVSFLNLDGSIGYLLYDLKTFTRHSNPAFKEMTNLYMTDQMIHDVVTDMGKEIGAEHVEVGEWRERIFESALNMENSDLLEISASPLKEVSGIVLFIAKIREKTYFVRLPSSGDGSASEKNHTKPLIPAHVVIGREHRNLPSDCSR